MLNEKVGKNLKRLRMLNEYSQDAVEIACNISHGTYSKIENGTGKIDLDRLEAFAKFYKTDVVTIMTMDDEGSFKRQDPNKAGQAAEPKTKYIKTDYRKTDVELARCQEKSKGYEKELLLLKRQLTERERTIKDKETIIELMTGEGWNKLRK